MFYQFKDCYIKYENNILTIGNSVIERGISLENGIPGSVYLKNVKTGYEFRSLEDKKCVMFGVPGFDFASSRISVYAYADDREGFSNNSAVAEVHFDKDNASVYAYFRIYPECGFINTTLSLDGIFGSGVEMNICQEEYSDYFKANNGDMEAVGIQNEHVMIHVTELVDFTDVHNNVVFKHDELMFHAPWYNPLKGQFFVFDDYVEKEAFMLVKEAPCAFGRFCDSDQDANFHKNERAYVKGFGVDFSGVKQFNHDIQLYNVTIGIGQADKLLSDYKKYYRNEWKDGKKGTFTMSNTWGDRNGDSRICEDFMLKEAQAGGKIGIDIIQLDDGWQKGLTANSRFVKKEKGEGVWGSGYYNTDPDFWMPAPHKFPSGFDKISDAIINNGAHVGLWFSPDFANDYENVEKDIETVVELHDKYHVKFFKIDGVHIINSTIGTKLLHFVKEVYKRTNNDISLDMDITGNQKRWGHLFNKQYGNLFLENRMAKNYRDKLYSYSYFPFSTLRNLWQLSEMIPAQRFQIEMPNRLLGIGSYKENDLLAPMNYTQDYLFAITMFACPLIWTEMSNLSEDDLNTLAKIMKVHDSIKKDLAHLDVTPIGQEPLGVNFTGFTALDENGKGYILMFRDCTKDNTFVFENVLTEDTSLELMYSNFEAKAKRNGKNVEFCAEKQRTFALYRVK